MKVDPTQAWKQIEHMVNAAFAALPGIAIALIVFVGFYLLAKGVRFLVQRFTGRLRRAVNLGRVIGRLAQATVILFGLLVALSIVVPSFGFGDLVKMLGLGGVAIGFAFKDILQNFLAGILILWSQPFRIGDQIVLKGVEGTVERIETRATIINTYDGRHVVIPNSDLFTQCVTVNTSLDKRRSQYDVGIGYGDDPDRASKLIIQAAKSVKGVLDDPPPDTRVTNLSDFNVAIRARWWTEPQNSIVSAVKDAVIRAIKRELTENGIDLPFPTQVVLFHDQTDESDGDRARQREGWPVGKEKAPQPRSLAANLERLAQAIEKSNFEENSKSA